MVRSRSTTVTGGRPATTGVIAGRYAISVGKPLTKAPPEFEWRSLAELARLESGHTPSRRVAEYWNGDIPWIGIRDATGNHGRQITETRETITQLGVDNSSARVLPAGTVCLSRTASVGYVVQMGRAMATSQDFVNWVCGPNLDPRYLKYVLLAEQDSLRRFAHGTTHQTIYYPEVKALHICVPGLTYQQAVVAVLGALDDKIEADRQAVALTQRLADAYFTKWRESLRESKFTTFGELASVNGGSTPKTGVAEYWDGEYAWAVPRDITALGAPYLFDTERHITAAGLTSIGNRMYPPGSIFMTSRATIGAFAVLQRPCAANQGFIVVMPKDGIHRWFLFHEMRSRVDDMIGLANGSTFLEISRGTFKNISTVLPSQAELNLNPPIAD